ncbi:hypothetical protein [Archaeoglobus neptunius]|uniref:hypothetical protein n=1 Tax=Archaeoglobus neptunius TaxID=2798580 RepID=UPI00192610E6|nr:hypothetical protein [Archaeoglobus neptunius]
MSLDKVVKHVVSVVGEEYEERVRTILKTLIEEFRIPEKEAAATVIKKFKEEGVQIKDATKKIADIDGSETNVTIVAKVLSISKGKGKAKAFARVGDDTGHARMILTSNAEVELEAGKVYRFKNVMVNEDGSLLVTKNTTARELEEDIEVKPLTMIGVVVSVAKNSGHVLRCPECGTPLKGGACTEHGKVEEPVERVEARVVVDNGRVARRFTLLPEHIEALTGLTLEKAREIKNKFDNEAVRQVIIDSLIGKYVRVEYLNRVPQSIEFTTEIPTEVV